MSCRMGCDTFNGLSDCYTYCGCTFMYSPIPISSDLKESVAKYQLSIYLSLHCADDYLSLCTGTSLEQVECLKQNGCMIEEATSLMSEVPKELWIAVQPSAIHYVVAAEQLEKYENYQQCATYCYELCVNSKDSSETCSQNCMLQFCYSYDYTSGGYYESQIAEKKAEERIRTMMLPVLQGFLHAWLGSWSCPDLRIGKLRINSKLIYPLATCSSLD